MGVRYKERGKEGGEIEIYVKVDPTWAAMILPASFAIIIGWTLALPS